MPKVQLHAHTAPRSRRAALARGLALWVGTSLMLCAALAGVAHARGTLEVTAVDSLTAVPIRGLEVRAAAWGKDPA